MWQRCACRIADWFAQLNQKMGGDLRKIRVVGEYMIEVWKAVGMNLDMVDFLWASDEINARPAEYWTLVMDIAIKFNLQRVMRCTQIMGRAEGDDLQASQIFYPCMQCADIFFLKVCFLGPPCCLNNCSTCVASFIAWPWHTWRVARSLASAYPLDAHERCSLLDIAFSVLACMAVMHKFT
jgi:hypothetical protein